MESHLPAIKPTGYRLLKQVDVGLWFTKHSLPIRRGPNEKPAGKPAKRRVFWSRLICSSGLLGERISVGLGKLLDTSVKPVGERTA